MVRRHASLVGLFLISAASLLFEVLLTKFFGSKLEHHYTFAIISTAMLGFGAAGVFVYLSPKRFDTTELRLQVLGDYAFWFGASCLLAVPLFCIMPLDPLIPDWRGTLALPLFFMMFAVPFFLCGVTVSYTLMASKHAPGVIYFWDLLGAGVGAALAAPCISLLTGYGATIVVGGIALASALVYRHGAAEPGARFKLVPRLGMYAAFVTAVVIYPPIGRTLYGHDIFSIKYGALRRALLFDFGGIQMTFWNAIARIDVSRTAQSMVGPFRAGISPRYNGVPFTGRFILVDGGASTRQFDLDAPASEQDFLRNSLWASPYAFRDPAIAFERSLVIGAGGGIDLLVAKSYRTRRVDGIELNPDTYRVLTGRAEDPERDRYLRWVKSDATSTVYVMNTEARHYCHTLGGKETYDVIEASAVDTLTAIQSAANALSENYLYTEDAVADYYRLLRPEGVLSLSHGYCSPGALTLRKFYTYLHFLESIGVERPGESVAVVTDGFWENSLLKKGRFSREEIDRLQAWADANQFTILYHPFQDADYAPVLPPAVFVPGMTDAQYDMVAKFMAPFIDPDRARVELTDLPFGKLARASSDAERARILAPLAWDVRPSTDDKPYFYFVRPSHATWTSAFDGAFLYPQRAVRWMFVAAALGALGLVIAPLAAARRRKGEGSQRGAVLALPFFALTGFGFMLIENSAFLNLTLFVGGPLYSLSVVLPSMLGGYAAGGLVCDRMLRRRPSGWVILLLYVAGFALYASLLRWGAPHLVGTPWVVRILAGAVVTAALGMLVGIAVPWYMSLLKQQSARDLSWMWAVSSAANVMGSMLFVPICFGLGRANTLVLAACAYALAITLATLMRPAQAGPAAAPQAPP